MITPTTPFHADSLYPNGEPTPAQGRPPLAHRRRDDAVPLELLCVRPIRWTVLLVAALVVTPSVPLQSRAAPLRPGPPRLALWMEPGANLLVLSRRDGVREVLDRARAAGVDVVMPEAKNAWGYVTYPSAFAPTIATSPLPTRLPGPRTLRPPSGTRGATTCWGPSSPRRTPAASGSTPPSTPSGKGTVPSTRDPPSSTRSGRPSPTSRPASSAPPPEKPTSYRE